jgi:hypothetical protein
LNEKHLLSKTSFLKAVQCQKSFFLYKKYYHLRDPLPPEKRAVFNRGHRVGELAHQLFPGGVDVSPDHVFKFSEAVEKTKELIALGQRIIYEAAFIFDETLVAIDILVKVGASWYAYEVKSSLKISHAYVMDAALQYYVIKNNLPELEDIAIVNLNEHYVLEDMLDVSRLFKITSVKKDALRNVEFIKYHIGQARGTYYKNELPSTTIGAHCFSPYACDFMGTCWKHTATNNTFEFSGISKKQAGDWLAKGYIQINEVPDEELSGTLLKQVRSYKENKEIVDCEKIREFLGRISYPLAFLDMEFYTPAIPKYKGKKPFELTPFLFSWLQVDADGSGPGEYYFIHEEDSNPEVQFIESFIRRAEGVKSILVFDTGQENAALNNIVRHHPQYLDAVKKIKKKFIDLADVFNNLWYYHPLQKGSTSLKRIHQSISGRDIYAELPVNSGILASYGYDEYLGEPDVFLKLEKKENLVKYCQADTRALWDIYAFLKEKCR